MKNGQNLAIVFLLTSAVILIGILVGSYSNTGQTAYANTPSKGGDYLQFTSGIASNWDLLYIIDTAARRMNAYNLNLNSANKGLELIGTVDLEQSFRAK